MTIKFFLTPYHTPENAHYHHAAVALAEGFIELGIGYSCNINYWKNFSTGNYIFNAVADNKQDIHIYSTSYFKLHGIVNKSAYNVLFDNDDGLFSLATSEQGKVFSKIFRSHYNKNLQYNSNVVPWAFGLSNRMMRASEKFFGENVTAKVFHNFRVDHSIRSKFVNDLLPLLNNQYPASLFLTSVNDLKFEEEILYHNQTGRRHNEAYYKYLNGSLFTLSCGGHLAIKPVSLRPKFNMVSRKLNHLAFLMGLSKKPFLLYQFDSWRLWECFYSNTCPITTHFESWGHILPEMPENFKHYIGVNYLGFNQAAKKILELNQQDINTIAESGRIWAAQHYAPPVTAKRFLNYINNK